MIEKVHSFGKDRSLVGVITQPGPELIKKEAPAVILLNAGLLHRVGPYRLHVKLARSLANLGFLVFRFDLSGIGDSRKHKDNRTYQEQIATDVEDSMTFITARHGIKKFVVMGLCSGADNAHKAVVRNDKVVGGILIDGYVYPTIGYYLRYYLDKLFKLASWRNKLLRLTKTKLTKKRNKEIERDTRIEGDFYVLPPKEKVFKELDNVIKRGTKLLYVFAGASNDYNYQNQFRDMFPDLDFKGNIRVEYIAGANHTFSLLGARDYLINTIENWLLSEFNNSTNCEV